jgi:CRP/FNR family transcriptional regulator, cyclic AMP receptor protein
MIRESDKLKEALDVASEVGWFAERSPSVRAKLARIMRVRDLNAGETLYHSGDKPLGVFGLVRGTLELAFPRVDGMETTILRSGPGFWIGDSGLFSGKPYFLTITATDQTRLLFIPGEKLLALVHAEPSLYTDFYSMIHVNAGTALKIIASLLTSPSEVRVAVRLLIQLNMQCNESAEVKLSQAKLAGMVSLSEPTLLRALKKLEDKGLIERSYGRIHIVDRHALLALCGETM